MVTTIEPVSPAALAGMKVGDILLSLDGAPLTGADDLVRVLTSDTINREVAFDLLRGGERLTVKLTPQERKRSA
jgi:S1-C subfamily serine protease